MSNLCSLSTQVGKNFKNKSIFIWQSEILYLSLMYKLKTTGVKTLVIHPKDPSTTFLEVIYKGMKEATVLTGNSVTQEELKAIIPDYDRVIIMGHGSPYGLFTAGGFVGNRGYIVDDSFVNILRNNPNNIYIWCHADVFVNRFNLFGFHSGMFVSEVGEAYACGIKHQTQKDVDESNYGFCELVKKYRTKSVDVIYRNVKRLYGVMAEHNLVAEYNYNRLHIKRKKYLAV